MCKFVCEHTSIHVCVHTGVCVSGVYVCASVHACIGDGRKHRAEDCEIMLQDITSCQMLSFV